MKNISKVCILASTLVLSLNVNAMHLTATCEIKLPGYDMVWPMSITMKAFTSGDDNEIKACIKMLMDTDTGTGFMHESFNKDDASKFTRAWFAWQNTLFGELILKLVNEGKTDLLNSVK
jgi:meiotically up-regulated gene 157 (Mug157) protein